MKFSMIDGVRRNAEPGLSGKCPACGATTIARCGEKNVWHWSHKGRRNCDHWWENETEWHRSWKNQFSPEWQEIVQVAKDGERHIADVKTDQGWVIEFQHSYIKPEERQTREAFYGSMAWVVDGLRRANDITKFIGAVRGGTAVIARPMVVKVHPSECRLVKEWRASRVPVFFDFGCQIKPEGLWLLVPSNTDHVAHLALVGRENFVSRLREGEFHPQSFIDAILAYERERALAAKARHAPQLVPTWMRKRRRRRF